MAARGNWRKGEKKDEKAVEFFLDELSFQVTNIDRDYPGYHPLRRRSTGGLGRAKQDSCRPESDGVWCARVCIDCGLTLSKSRIF
ncbi:hypothetical protein RRG08_002950 [Elysia crispata]|uniref:Uncharacterized protein n=1 Tax=Elysia crispata TaxID=231223 RepID=A0AAE1E2Z0_9GAST|nr:hypothetical protein RRG08_002950 [Elysia crispata]